MEHSGRWAIAGRSRLVRQSTSTYGPITIRQVKVVKHDRWLHFGGDLLKFRPQLHFQRTGTY